MTQETWTSRSERLLGAPALRRLAQARVAVFGVGGVGGAAVEGLARSGIGYLRLIDADTVARSNLNRQLVARLDTLGRPKVEVAAELVKGVNPQALVEVHKHFYGEESPASLLEGVDYVLDCIDTVSAKLLLVERCQALQLPLIASMGAGNRLDPSALYVADLFQTETDPLARVMRRELRKRGIRHLKVVASREPPQKPHLTPEEEEKKSRGELLGKQAPGSLMFVPASAGLLMAATVVQDLLKGGA